LVCQPGRTNAFNGFVHTADWDYFIDCPSAFPIAYEVMALVLQKHMFNGKRELRMNVHQPPIGCINDLCIQKQEIILKLRPLTFADTVWRCLTQYAGFDHSSRSYLDHKMCSMPRTSTGITISKLVINRPDLFCFLISGISGQAPYGKALYLLS
jgi:hypothetical protein